MAESGVYTVIDSGPDSGLNMNQRSQEASMSRICEGHEDSQSERWLDIHIGQAVIVSSGFKALRPTCVVPTVWVGLVLHQQAAAENCLVSR